MSNNISIPEELSIKSVFNICKRKLKNIVSFIVIFTIVMIGYSYYVPYVYVAKATILPPGKDEGGMGLSGFIQSMASSGISIGGGMGGGNKSGLFSDMLKSKSVAAFIVKDLNLKNISMYKHYENDDDLFADISRLIIVEIEKSGMLSISVKMGTGHFPVKTDKDFICDLTADIVNSAVKGLDSLVRSRSVSSARQSREYIEKELMNYKTKLDTIDNKIVSFQEGNHVMAIEDQTKAIVGQAMSVGSEIAKAENSLNLAKTEFQSNSPKIRMFQNQYDLLKEQYQRIQSGGLIRTDAFSIPLSKVPRLVNNYANLIREKKILEQIALFLETQKHQEAIQEKKDVPVIEMMDKAVPQHKPVAPNRRLMVLIAPFIALILIIVFFTGLALYRKELYISKEKQTI